jgi:hypothetical protein
MKEVDYTLIPYDSNERNAFTFQQRRHQEWTDNYELYRNKVIVNRLTQRQAVNIPLTKETLRTILANIDEFPSIEFEELGNDKDKEIAKNELWKNAVVEDKMELKDIVDKKQELLYGITWRKLNIRNRRFESEVKEPFDILVDRYVDPTDLETAGYIIEMGIYQSLDDLESNPLISKEALDKVRTYYATQQGLVRAEQVTQQISDKNQRLNEMGVPDIFAPMLGQTMVEIKAHYVKVWDDIDKEAHIHVVLRSVGGIQGPEGVGNGSEVLMGKPLMDILNVDFYPFVKWSDDPERNDVYPDGVADTCRVPNQVLNVWFSQLVENRTLRNFGMHFFNSTVNENWSPGAWTPEAWGFYPLPGKPDDILQSVEIPELSESLDEMQFIKNMVASATAATSVKTGDTQKGKVTLGEIELVTQAANERITSISKFYMLAQKEFGEKWSKIMMANSDKLDAVTLYKKSYKGNYFKKNMKPSDWKSDAGYSCRVVSSAEREQESIKTVQKLQAVAAQFPGNTAMQKIYQKKLLDFGGLTPDEQNEVLNLEKQKQQMALQAPAMPPGATPGAMPGGMPSPMLNPPAPAPVPQPALTAAPA